MTDFVFPWGPDPSADLLPEAQISGPAAPRHPKPLGRRKLPSAMPETDLPYHRLIVSGMTCELDSFVSAARGSGVTPWSIDGNELEEGLFALAISQPAGSRTLDVQGCRILARQLRDAVEARNARAAAVVGRSVACPLDLHALIPVPGEVLSLGPCHPQAVSWLEAHWGLRDRMRQACVLPALPALTPRLPRTHRSIGYGFFLSRGDTMLPALATLRSRWPLLRYSLQLGPT